MRNILVIATLALATVSTTSSAKLTDYAKTGFWDIFADDHDCTLAAEFDNNNELSLDFNARENTVTVRFRIPQTRSLKDKDIRELQTVFSNGTPDSLDFGWGKKKFMAFTVEDRTYVAHTFNQEFLVDLSRYKTLAFFYNDVVISAYKLEGSGRAVSLLRACANARSKDNPSDPFKSDTI